MIEINGNNVNYAQVWSVAHKNEKVKLSEDARMRVSGSREYLVRKSRSSETIYGVNTGFGPLCSVRISDQEVVDLQLNFVRSHSSGIGDPFTLEESRAIMFLRANALATGHSGVRPELIDFILKLLNLNLIPVIPQQGSVGASGDLAPLSHLALALVGEGKIWKDGSHVPSGPALENAGLSPLKLEMKEGLSLANGCQVMTAIGLLNAARAVELNMLFDISGAMSLEALRGSRFSFDPLVPSTRRHPGEAKTARNLLRILGDRSTISDSHANCDRVQDVYSLRCMPAVHGAGKDTLSHVLRVLEIEANSSTDNPLVFPEQDKILSCGNFHGEPVAMAVDFLSIAMAELGNISSCRIEKLTNHTFSGLPPFLAMNPGLQSGHMIVQYAAASLVSENKGLAHPASVDSIPTSANKEDHVSMGTIGARKLTQIVKNVTNIVSMELLSAAQALDHLKPLTPVAGVQCAYQRIRQSVSFAERDRVFAHDIDLIRGLVNSSELLEVVENNVGSLEW